jgi:hypothetical protein
VTYGSQRASSLYRAPGDAGIGLISETFWKPRSAAIAFFFGRKPLISMPLLSVCGDVQQFFIGKP